MLTIGTIAGLLLFAFLCLGFDLLLFMIGHWKVQSILRECDKEYAQKCNKEHSIKNE